MPTNTAQIRDFFFLEHVFLDLGTGAFFYLRAGRAIPDPFDQVTGNCESTAQLAQSQAYNLKVWRIQS